MIYEDILGYISNTIVLYVGVSENWPQYGILCQSFPSLARGNVIIYLWTEWDTPLSNKPSCSPDVNFAKLRLYITDKCVLAVYDVAPSIHSIDIDTVTNQGLPKSHKIEQKQTVWQMAEYGVFLSTLFTVPLTSNSFWPHSPQESFLTSPPQKVLLKKSNISWLTLRSYPNIALNQLSCVWQDESWHAKDTPIAHPHQKSSPLRHSSQHFLLHLSG